MVYDKQELSERYDKLQRQFKKSFDTFIYDLKSPEETQYNLLMQILNKNKNSSFGLENNFGNISSIEEFQRKVSIMEYEGFTTYINRMLKGEGNVLTQEEVKTLQPTSGSVSGTKLIPFTHTLKEQFQKGVFTWLYGLFEGHPNIKTGRFYWSITPIHKKEIQSLVPIGFGNDLDYFNPEQYEDLAYLSAVPFDMAKKLTFEQCRTKTLEYLCSSQDLSFISVWNPTFLSALVDGLDVKSMWSNLRLISCWTDGNSSLYVDRIRELFPNAEIQGKGLMSTEAITSIPLSFSDYPLLAINSHFFEFKDNSSQEIFLPKYTKKGVNYEVIVTTGGGLYRYATGDIVEIMGKHNGCPSIKFLGRKNNCSDYVGEKLNELHVSDILKRAINKYGLAVNFMMISPEQEEGVRYYLHIQTSSGMVPDGLQEFVEKGLRENFHYDYARNTGQIKKLGLNILRYPRPEQSYLMEEERSGIRAGSIKQTFLSKRLGWKEKLK